MHVQTDSSNTTPGPYLQHCHELIRSEYCIKHTCFPHFQILGQNLAWERSEAFRVSEPGEKARPCNGFRRNAAAGHDSMNATGSYQAIRFFR